MAIRSVVVLVTSTLLGLLATSGCRFDQRGLPFSVDGAGLPDSAMGDGGVGPDGAGPGVDGQVQPDAAPTCVPAACQLGCNLLLDRCNRLEPSNFSAQAFYGSVSAGVSCAPGETVLVDTDLGSIIGDVPYRPGGQQGVAVSGIHWDVVTQSGGVDLTVFGLTHLDVPNGCNVSVSGSRPAAFYVTGNVAIGGRVAGYGEAQNPGPGGGMGGVSNGDPGATCGGDPGDGGAQGGSGSTQSEAGGGGGGLGGTGGNGADSTYPGVNGGAGGVPVGVSVNLIPLVGGCGGGAGGGPDTEGDGGSGGDGGYGGAGGGGLQISAGGSITILVGGGIDVGAGGGQGGQFGAGGGGGGTGGAILLEAAVVSNGGLLAANGGGGGAGAGGLTFSGEDGEPGWFSLDPADGGAGTTFGGGGGDGAAGAFANGSAGAENYNAGGGGGSAGLIRVNYLLAVTLGVTSPTAISQQQGVALW